MPNPCPASEPKDRLSELKAQCQQISEETHNLFAAADRDGRCLDDAELARVSALNGEFEAITKEIQQRETALANAAKLDSVTVGRRTEAELAAPQPQAAAAPQQAAAPSRISVLDPKRKYHAGTHGMGSLGEWAKAVRHGTLYPQQMDERLVVFNSVSTYQNETAGAEGGFAVPPDFRAEILRVVTGEDSIVGRCTQLTTSSNELVFPLDESAPWSSSGIVRSYWDGEAGTATATKHSVFKKRRIPVDKLTSLVHITDELLEDAPALSTYLAGVLREEMEFRIGNAIFRGTGVGMPEGILNSNAIISVAKVGSQVADTLVARNVASMFARLYAPCRANAVWFINQDVETELQFLMKQGKLDTGAVDTGWGVPMYVQPGGLAGSPYGSLLGRPVVPTQLCETLGDQGDILLVDLTKYYVVSKSNGGPKFDTSMHFAFDQNSTAFRMTWRMGGAPKWTSAISPRDGSNTLSYAVTLDARA